MTKTEYLEELKKELINNGVTDIDDIISEYQDHFTFKAEEGYTEDEIAKKLSSPKEIASEYAKTTTAPKDQSKKAVSVAIVSAISVPLAAVYMLMWASVAVLAGFTLVSFLTSFCLITTINICGVLPAMPYACAFVLGIACIAIFAITCIGTIYLFMYVKHWGKIYLRWCKNLVNGNNYPSVSMHPQISKKFYSVTKLITIIALVTFISTILIGYFLMCIISKSFEPWHVWNWFID